MCNITSLGEFWIVSNQRKVFQFTEDYKTRSKSELNRISGMINVDWDKKNDLSD